MLPTCCTGLMVIERTISVHIHSLWIVTYSHTPNPSNHQGYGTAPVLVGHCLPACATQHYLHTCMACCLRECSVGVHAPTSHRGWTVACVGVATADGDGGCIMQHQAGEESQQPQCERPLLVLAREDAPPLSLEGSRLVDHSVCAWLA